MDLPDFDLKSFEMPKIDIEIPEIPKLNIEIPEMPKINIVMPDMPEMPQINLPAIDLKAVDMASDALGFDMTIPVIGLGVVAVVLALASAGGSSESQEGGSSSSSMGSGRPKKKAQKKNPLEIPYDAAARLSYDAWCEANDEAFNEGGYAHFREIFNAKAVADATAKKLARDLNMFKNEAPKAPAPRKLSPPKPTKTKPAIDDDAFFFAKPMTG